MIKAEGFDKAIIGYDMYSERIVYDKYIMCEILMNDGMSEEDAIEYLAYNVWCAYIGEHTPIYVDLMNNEEINELL